jgi:Tol biopolymer transport system component
MVPNECENPTFADDLPGGVDVRSRDSNYMAPCFNPGNSNEFIYVLMLHELKQLRKRNLITKEDIFLADCRLLVSPPRWHKNGWIVFENGWQIFKIKENGDSLTNVTPDNESFSPDWSPDGNKLIVSSRKDISNGKLYILNSNQEYTEISNTIGYTKCTWSSDENLIAYVHTRVMGFLDLTTGNQTDLTEKTSIYGMSWFADAKNILWASEEGLFKTNIETQTRTTIKKGCFAKMYFRPALSADNSTMIVERQDKKKVDDYTIYQETNLYIMNADGSNERKLEF